MTCSVQCNGFPTGTEDLPSSVRTNRLPMACALGEPFCAFGGSTAGDEIVTGDGTNWTVKASPDPDAGITDISCGSPSLCMAVDEKGNALKWDGTRWSAPTAVAYTEQ